jgi:hypothetical protein
MNATVTQIPDELLADMQAVANSVSSVATLDRELVQRIRGRSRQVQAEQLQRFGVREIAVELIREVRDEE